MTVKQNFFSAPEKKFFQSAPPPLNNCFHMSLSPFSSLCFSTKKKNSGGPYFQFIIYHCRKREEKKKKIELQTEWLEKRRKAKSSSTCVWSIDGQIICTEHMNIFLFFLRFLFGRNICHVLLLPAQCSREPKWLLKEILNNCFLANPQCSTIIHFEDISNFFFFFLASAVRIELTF